MTSLFEIKKPINEDMSYMNIRPKKTDDPAIGTYDVEKSNTFVEKKDPKWTFNKSK